MHKEKHDKNKLKPLKSASAYGNKVQYLCYSYLKIYNEKISLTILFSLLSLITFAQSLKVVIKQNGKVVQPVNNVYELKNLHFNSKLLLQIWKVFSLEQLQTKVFTQLL